MYMNVSFNVHDLRSLNTSFSVIKTFVSILLATICSLILCVEMIFQNN